MGALVMTLENNDLHMAANPGSLATPKSRPRASDEQYAVDESAPGITQRGDKIRPGVDRWHYPDGSIRNPGREKNEREISLDVPAKVSLYNKSSSAWGSASEGEVTTTCATGTECSATSSSSESPSTVTVGFWRHGIWVPRARTAAEQRAHRGGSGPRRTQRRADRVAAYHDGTWKPAWLTRYIDDRRVREAAQQGGEGPGEGEVTSEAASGNTQLTEPDTAAVTTSDQTKETLAMQWDDVSTDPVSSSDPTEQTDPDPWAGQWQGDPSWWGWTSSWWNEWGGQTCSSSSTTTLPVGDEFLPNQAFFPIVQPIDEEHSWLMHLTGAERRMLQENGVQGPVIERIDALLLQLDDFAATDAGPEARWGLARLSRS